MNQHRVPDVSTEYHKQERDIAAVIDTYGRLPRLFAVLDQVGVVAAWGIEFSGGGAVTCSPAGGAFGTWESPVNAAALLGDGSGPLYLTRTDV